MFSYGPVWNVIDGSTPRRVSRRDRLLAVQVDQVHRHGLLLSNL